MDLRQSIIRSIAFVLRRHWPKPKGGWHLRNEHEIDHAAAKVVEHLELSGVGFTRKAPVEPHSTHGGPRSNRS